MNNSVMLSPRSRKRDAVPSIDAARRPAWNRPWGLIGKIFLIAALALSLGGCGILSGGRGSKSGLAAAKTAKNYIGTPYVYGGRSPSGFDCSGLTSYVYQRHGVKLPRSSTSQAKVGRKIQKGRLKPGDLVFFAQNGRRGQVNHVGIYIGDGKFIHAPSTGKKVSIAKLNDNYFKKNYHSARRVG